jgi:hypothetical protein
VIARDPNAVTVSEITRLYVTKRYGDDHVTPVRRTLRVAASPESWKAYLRKRLQKRNGSIQEEVRANPLGQFRGGASGG